MTVERQTFYHSFWCEWKILPFDCDTELLFVCHERKFLLQSHVLLWYAFWSDMLRFLSLILYDYVLHYGLFCTVKSILL